MNTLTDIPYGKKAWTIHAAAGGGQSHAEYISAVPQTIPTVINCFLEAPLTLHVQFLVTLHLQKSIPLLFTCQQQEVEKYVCSGKSATSWDSKDSYLRYWWTHRFAK
jgi:hypothetical protein